MIIEDPSLSSHGYHLLPIATSYLVGNNREFDVSDIIGNLMFQTYFEVFYSFFVEGSV